MATAALLAGAPRALADTLASETTVLPRPSGKLLRTIPFSQEGSPAMGTCLSSGLDGRLFTDLAALDAQSLLTPVANFYVRTLTPDTLDRTRPWQIAVGGKVARPGSLSMASLRAAERPCGTHAMECSGNGSFAHFGMLSCAQWHGVPLLEALAPFGPALESSRILVSGYDNHSQPSTSSVPGASWIFTADDLKRAGGFLATRMNGEPLTPAHGAPVRLMMPRWYGCTCIKWVNEIKVVDDNEPATSQMKEFAGRTHQKGVPELARDYQPASMDLAAMPVRIEQWQDDKGKFYRVVGVQWGEGCPSDKLVIRFAPRDPYVAVEHCPTEPADAGWMLWSHTWRPRVSGMHIIQLRVNDPKVRTRRLATGFYVRYAVVEAAV